MQTINRKEKLLIWQSYFQMVVKMIQEQIHKFLPLIHSDPYENFGLINQHMTELNKLWNEFLMDKSFTHQDFYAWLKHRKNTTCNTMNAASTLQEYSMSFEGVKIKFSARSVMNGIKENEEVIFVLDGDNHFFCYSKDIGKFYHSSFWLLDGKCKW